MILYDKKKMTDISVVGGKAAGLAKLIAYGCSVPDFFVITAGTVIDDEFAAELQTFAAHLHCDDFSVRSSNVQEDGATNSFAGQYLTLLNVKREDLLEAIGEVARSVQGQKASKYAGRFGVDQSKMAIIVQEQIRGTYSGVLFTQAPSSSDEMLLEYVEGAGETLVGGTVTPQKLFVKKNRAQEDPSELVRTAFRLEGSEGYPLDIEWTVADKLYFLQMRPITVLGDALPEIPDRNWQFYVYRDFCLLAHSVQIRATESQLQEKLFGFSVPIHEGLLVNGREFYSEENDLLTIKKWSDHDKDGFFEEFIAAIKKMTTRTKRRASVLKNKSFRDRDTASLFAEYRKEMEAYIESYVPLMMRPDDYLLHKYQTLIGELSSETADILTPIWEKTAYSAEKEDILRAKISGDIDEYLDQYEWINNPLGKKVVPLTKRDVEKRLERLTVRRAKNMLEERIKSRAQRKLKFDQFIEGIENEELRRLMRLISRFIYLRTYTAENSDRLFYYIRERLILEIADRLNISHEEILCMTYQEIAALEHGARPDRQTMIKRRSGELVTFLDGQNCSYYGNTVSALLKRLLPYEKGDMGAIFSGDIACSGEVCGQVKIVRNFSEVDKVEEGDIVVTSMTTPEIVAALEKAGGIITDEGGVTCHAAIIAREYGIPCLVGTKCATTVFQDGAKISLDCFTGSVKVIQDEK